MRKHPGLALLLAVCLAPGAQAQREFQFFVSMLDAGGAPVATLSPGDLDVREDGVAGRVVKVEPIDWPIKVQVLVDNGVGMGSASLVPLRNGVRGLLEALPEGVEVSLLSTAPQPRFLVRPTMDRSVLLKGVELLTPDSGAARFVDALAEASQRIDRERGNDFPVVIIVGSTAAEGGRVVIRQTVDRLLQRFADGAATVHVVMLSSGSFGQLTAGGAAQTEVGISVAKLTGGRYENISAASRLATLLPEIGKQVAVSHARQSRQFRITFGRPAGASGPIGTITLGAPGGLRATLSPDGHLP